jgi:hypothetical protein
MASCAKSNVHWPFGSVPAHCATTASRSNKVLLVHAELTSTAIAGRVGMPGPAAFGKFFRRQTGETPPSFRDRLRGVHNGG